MTAAVEAPSWPSALRLLVAAVVAAAAAVVAACWLAAAPWEARDLVTVLVLGAASAAAAQFQLELPYTAEESSYDVNDVLWVAALLLVQPELVVLAVAAGVVVGQLPRGWSVVKVLFNSAQHTLGVAAAAAVFLVAGPQELGQPLTWLVALVASAAYHTVNMVAVGAAISLAERTSFRGAAAASIGVPQAAGNVALALLGALLWETQPLALVLLVPPVVLVYLAYRSWVHALQDRNAMRDMASTADQVARSGDHGIRLPAPMTRADVRVLADTLNRMLARLDESMQRERRFIRETSHELLTPITIVRGHLEVLGPDPSRGELAETTDIALDELDRMARLVQDMSLLARTEDPSSLRLDDLSVKRLLDAVAAKAQPLLDRPLVVTLSEDGTVRADEQRMIQALLNLVANAERHTPPGTRVTLASCATPGHWLFEVIDEGPGIPEGQLERVFEPFHTGAATTAGTGLGLAIVAGIARAHGGRSGVRNRSPRGATFWISVPR